MNLMADNPALTNSNNQTNAKAPWTGTSHPGEVGANQRYADYLPASTLTSMEYSEEIEELLLWFLLLDW